MSSVAILGAGPIGAAVAHRLAQRGRIHEIRFVDASAGVASGKALDILQAGPVEKFDVRLSGTADVLAAASADVVVVADEHAEGEWQGDRGLAMLRPLLRAGIKAPLVFAGPRQAWLMEACARELKVPGERLVGSAPSALVSAARAFAGLELNLSSVELTIVGRPPAFVVGWSTATTAGALVTDRVPAHRLLAITQALARLWPSGPHAIGAATAPIVEALLMGSRQFHPALTMLDGELGARGHAVMLPLELGRGRVLGHVLPSLSPQERTELSNGIASRG